MFRREDCTREAIENIDRQATDRFGIPSLILMEHASIGIARRAMEMLAEAATTATPSRVIIPCGPGGNGGDGLATARHLHSLAVETLIIDLAPSSRHTDRCTNRQICQKIGIPIVEELPPSGSDAHLIIDCILGSGTHDQPRDHLATAIEWINRQSIPVLAVDLPSGMVADTGECRGASVIATETIALCLPHLGLQEPAGLQSSGDVWITPIGCPSALLPENASPFPPQPQLLIPGPARPSQ